MTDPTLSKPRSQVRSGLFIGAAVVLLDLPDYGSVVGLIRAIHGTDYETTDQLGQKKTWTGLRPMIDAVFISDKVRGVAADKDTDLVHVTNLAHELDIVTRLSLEGKPAQMIVMCPRYAAVKGMDSY